jgi:hypothetical protein
MAASVRSALLAAAVAAAPMPAHALNIVLNPDSSFSTQPNGAAALYAFQKAANYWNTVLTNNTTLVFDVSYAQLATNIIGSTGSNGIDVTTRSVYQGLATNAATALDAVTVPNLHPLTAAGGVGYRQPAPNTLFPGSTTNGLGLNTTPGSVYDNDDTVNNTIIAANTANAKVLGIAFNAADTYNGNGSDASITFSSAFNFDFNPTDGVGSGKQDFVSVAVHEMGHALGFVSGADTYDYFANPNGPCDTAPACAPVVGNTLNFDNFSILSVWDLFRYSTNGPANSGFDPATGQRYLQLDPNRGAGFSIDGVNLFNPTGPGGFANLSTGQFNGDGSQASHWKDSAGFFDVNNCFVSNQQIGIMDPTSGSCQMGYVTANDLAAFDAMGYNLNFNILNNLNYSFSSAQIYDLAGLASIFSAPETATWAQLVIGFGGLGTSIRRRRRASAAGQAA